MSFNRSFFIVSALAATAAAHADEAFSSFGTGNSFDQNNGYNVASATSGLSQQSLAFQFTSQVSGNVGAIEFAALYGSGSGVVRVGLYEDNGDLVGNLLVVDSPTVQLGQKLYQINIPSFVQVPLTANTKYWIGLQAQDDTFIGWNFADPAVTGVGSFNFDTGSPNTGTADLSAFRVTTQAVPEPATMVALAAGVGVMLRRRKR